MIFIERQAYYLHTFASSQPDLNLVESRGVGSVIGKKILVRSWDIGLRMCSTRIVKSHLSRTIQ